ncbi:hypothetical protein B0H17DRAFT_1200691 [Mycena rosella]|uniref:Uncharacterized protein n=1 Tax=Mycena rosella TaxID=1033263 RepID=A0AAD7DHW3_MYCRO|nr:hypothetical protein B0H17DRAFT_1200691 [Mycena rosella]
MSTEPSTDSYATTSFSSHFSSQSQSEGPHAPQNSVAMPSAAVTGSAVLNLSDPKDLFPADTPVAFIRMQSQHSASAHRVVSGPMRAVASATSSSACCDAVMIPGHPAPPAAPRVRSAPPARAPSQAPAQTHSAAHLVLSGLEGRQ